MLNNVIRFYVNNIALILVLNVPLIGKYSFPYVEVSGRLTIVQLFTNLALCEISILQVYSGFHKMLSSPFMVKY